MHHTSFNFPNSPFFRDVFELCARSNDPKWLDDFLAGHGIDMNLPEYADLNSSTFLQGFYSSRYTWIDEDDYKKNPDLALEDCDIVPDSEIPVLAISFSHEYLFDNLSISALRSTDKQHDGIIQQIFQLYTRKEMKFVEFLHHYQIDFPDTASKEDLVNNQKKIDKYLMQPHLCLTPCVELITETF